MDALGRVGWLAVAAVLVAAFTFGERVARLRQRRRWATECPSRLCASVPPWPGLRAAAGAVGLALVFVLCRQLMAADLQWPAGRRVTLLIEIVAAAACAWALFGQAASYWSATLIEIALALVTAGACAAVTLGISLPTAAPPHLPAPMLGALVVALAVMSWLWCWLAGVWEQQLDARVSAGPNRAWTTAGRMIPLNLHFSFVCAAVAWLLGAWLAVRPLWTTSAGGSLIGGLLAELVLVLTLAGCARRTRRKGYVFLAAASAVAVLVFVAVRMLG